MAPPSRPRDTPLPGAASCVAAVRPGSLSTREPAEMGAHPFVVDLFFVLDRRYLLSLVYLLQSGDTRVRGRDLVTFEGPEVKVSESVFQDGGFVPPGFFKQGVL